MSKMLRSAPMVSVFCLLVTCSVGFSNELVVNGDFEQDVADFIAWPGYVGNENPPDVPEWFGAGGRGINPVNPGESNPSQIPFWPSPLEGGRGINPISEDDDRGIAPFRDNGDNDTSIAFLQGTMSIGQTIGGLTVGTDYVLSVDFNARNCCEGEIPIGRLAFNGEPVEDFPGPEFDDGAVEPVFDTNPWYNFEHSFTADSADLLIEFSTEPLMISNGDSTFLLDNISLKAAGDATELVTNGDFESDVEGFFEWPGYVGGVGRNAPFRDNGDNSTSVAFLQGDATLEQDVSGFEVGEEYVLQLDYNARNCCGGALPAAELFLDGELVEDFPDTLDGIEPVGAGNPWYNFETIFVADAETKTFQVRAFPAFGGDSTLVVDNISIRKVGGDLPGDYNSDGVLDAMDINLQSDEMKKDQADQDLATFDHNGDNVVDFTDRSIWVKDLRRTWIGDSNLDNEFNSGDLVAVFAAGRYETGEMANWEQGDWNGDMLFNSTDLVAAFSDGGYEQGPQPAALAAIPEPTSWVMLILGGLGIAQLCRRRNNKA